MLDGKSAQMKINGGQCPSWYMPNADGVGYYRFSMAEADRSALVDAIARRDDAEQLVYADSVDADFHRGVIDADEVLASMRQLAPSRVRQIALGPLETVGWIYDHEVRNEEQRAVIRDAVAKAYLPRLESLGYERRSGESADDMLMRSSLASALGLEFRLPSVRAALLQQGEAALQKKDGKLDLDAANPDLLRNALSVAVEEHGKLAVDALIAAIPNTTDPTKRNAMLGALGHAPGAEADVARDFALTPQVKVGEMFMVLYGNRDTRAQRDGLWNWFTAHYRQILDRTGVFSGAYLPGVAGGGGCSQEEAGRVQAFFQPKLKQVPGLDRGLAQTREEILLCSALKDEQAREPMP
jgi:alanyl aminopeptidase